MNVSEIIRDLDEGAVSELREAIAWMASDKDTPFSNRMIALEKIRMATLELQLANDVASHSDIMKQTGG